MKTGKYSQLAPVLFGSGSIVQCGEKAKELGMHKVMVITDPMLAELGYDKKVADSLQSSQLEAVVWAKAQAECPAENVKEGAAFAKSAMVDGIIGIGGGSSLDVAKAVAVIAANTDKILEEIPVYRAGKKTYDNNPLPCILLPTTSGTGAECTFVAVINDPIAGGKVGLPAPPAYAIVDPELTLGTPPLITAFSGLDAFSHAVESLTAKGNTYHTDILAGEAIRLIYEWLPKACENTNNLEAREKLAFASNLAGIAFNEAGVHIGHSIAHALGYAHHMAHGHACALSTPAIIEYVTIHHQEKTHIISNAMSLQINNANAKEVGKQTADAVRHLMAQVGIPSLAQAGLTHEQTLALIDMVDGDPLSLEFDGPVTKTDSAKMLERMYDGYGE